MKGILWKLVESYNILYLNVLTWQKTEVCNLFSMQKQSIEISIALDSLLIFLRTLMASYNKHDWLKPQTTKNWLNISQRLLID